MIAACYNRVCSIVRMGALGFVFCLSQFSPVQKGSSGFSVANFSLKWIERAAEKQHSNTIALEWRCRLSIAALATIGLSLLLAAHSYHCSKNLNAVTLLKHSQNFLNYSFNASFRMVIHRPMAIGMTKITMKDSFARIGRRSLMEVFYRDP